MRSRRRRLAAAICLIFPVDRVGAAQTTGRFASCSIVEQEAELAALCDSFLEARTTLAAFSLKAGSFFERGLGWRDDAGRFGFHANNREFFLSDSLCGFTRYNDAGSTVESFFVDYRQPETWATYGRPGVRLSAGYGGAELQRLLITLHDGMGVDAANAYIKVSLPGDEALFYLLAVSRGQPSLVMSPALASRIFACHTGGELMENLRSDFPFQYVSRILRGAYVAGVDLGDVQEAARFAADWFHRRPFIDARVTAMGHARAQGTSQPAETCGIVNWRYRHDLCVPGFITYPADGEKGVPFAWSGIESPAPFPHTPEPIGVPLSVSFTDPLFRGASLSLTDEHGRRVELIKTSLLADRDHFVEAVPRSPLRPETWRLMRVQAAGQSRMIRFQTAPLNPAELILSAMKGRLQDMPELRLRDFDLNRAWESQTRKGELVLRPSGSMATRRSLTTWFLARMGSGSTGTG